MTAHVWHRYIYLASASPRRRQLLEQIGVAYEMLLADAHENAEALEIARPGERAEDYAPRVARAKLRAARERLAHREGPAAPILCADTTVALGSRILGKPIDAADAAGTLAALSGRTHRVITAVAVASARRTWSAESVSRVRFARLSAADIDRYVASGEPFGKAGAYAIQSAMAAHIEHVEGSYSGIMGLPLYETATLLRAARVAF
jgi:septum formation protein